MSSARAEVGALYDPEAFRRLAEGVVAIAARYLETDESRAVNTAASPEAVAADFAGPLPRAPSEAAGVLERLERAVAGRANHLVHPLYVGHQVAPPLPASAAADLLISAQNNGLAVWEMSPALTPIEWLVLDWWGALLGWRRDDERGFEGTFATGGTEGNTVCLAAARAAALPQAFERGMAEAGARACVVAAESAHYCVERACGLLGLGTSALVKVPPAPGDPNGRLDPALARAALARAEREGRKPIALVACAGSTPTGAIDELAPLAALARERSLWFHVDAAHAGALLLSEKLRPRLNGLELADSVAIDLHKLMFLPISTALVLVRGRGRLEAAFRQNAPYIFHARSDGPSWDQGPRSFQCSRRGDALRAWLALELHGADAIARLQEHVVAVAAAAARIVAARPGFEVPHRPDTNILCFRRVPARLAGDEAALDAHNAALRERVNRSGRAFVTGTVLGGRRVLRISIMNPRTEERHVARLLEILERASDELLAGA